MGLRVGILGAGMMGAAHAQAYRQVGAEIAGIADLDEMRAVELARCYGSRPYTAMEELIAAGINAVSVCLPHNLHLRAACLAASQGVHVLVEKPLANTLAEGFAILDACQANGVKLMVGFTQRFLTGFRQVHEMAVRGAFGRIGMVVEQVAAGGAWPAVPDWYRQRSAAGGGIAMIGNSHTADRLHWLLGEPLTVYGMVQQIGPTGDVEDAACAVIRYASGAQAAVTGLRSPLVTHRRRWTMDLYGSEAEARVSLEHTNEQTLEITTADGTQEQAFAAVDAFASEIREFLSAIAEDRQPSPSGHDGLVSLATVLAIYESARTGCPVHVAEFMQKTGKEKR